MPPSFSPPQAGPYATPPYMPPVQAPYTGQMPGAMMPNQNVRYSPSIERQPAAPTQNTLQSVPGLPARPHVELPFANRMDMQRMHTGQAPPPPPPPPADTPAHSPLPAAPMTLADAKTDDDVEAALKHLKNEFRSDPAGRASAEEAEKEIAARAISSKKKKSKPTSSKLVYSDARETPEEKMAKWGKYAIKHNDGPEFIQGEVGGAVTGVTVDEDTVMDVQD